jgi:PKD repeat protein
MERRTFLATTGAGAGVAAVGTTGVGGSPSGTTVVSTFEATATDGFFAFGVEDPASRRVIPQNNLIPVYNAIGDLALSGEIRDNGTWKLNTVDFPEYEHTVYVSRTNKMSIEMEIRATDHSTAGTFDPANGLVTAPMTMELDFPEYDFDVLPFSFSVALTTDTSGDLSGRVNRPTESTLRLKLVENEFSVQPDSEQGSPSPSGRNWLSIEFNVTVADPSALDGAEIGPAPVVGNTPPQDLDGDGLYENVRGDGEFDITDVQALFDNLDTGTVQSASAAFNFSGGDPDRVTVLDVQGLFNRLRGS